jgi:hypothetical protein
MNTFEADARALKVAQLVTEIDRCVRSVGFDPYNDAAEILTLLARWTGESWSRIAVSIGKRPPSNTTIEHIFNVYRSRAAVSEVA